MFDQVNLIALAVLVAALLIVDLSVLGDSTDGTDQDAKMARMIVCAAYICIWLVPTILLCNLRVARCCVRCCYGYGQQLKTREDIPAALVEMTASLLHTKWRKDRAMEFKTTVPRWKVVEYEEYTTWLQALEKDTGTEQLRNVLFSELDVPSESHEEFMKDIQATSDLGRAAKRNQEAVDRAGMTAAEAYEHRKQQYEDCKSDSKYEIADCLRNFNAKFPMSANTTVPPSQRLYIVDINHDFCLLPPTWQRANRVAAHETLEVCDNHSDLGAFLSDLIHLKGVAHNRNALHP